MLTLDSKPFLFQPMSIFLPIANSKRNLLKFNICLFFFSQLFPPYCFFQRIHNVESVITFISMETNGMP